jgi:hypothetical protein
MYRKYGMPREDKDARSDVRQAALVHPCISRHLNVPLFVNEHFEFIFNAVSASAAILRQVLLIITPGMDGNQFTLVVHLDDKLNRLATDITVFHVILTAGRKVKRGFKRFTTIRTINSI